MLRHCVLTGFLLLLPAAAFARISLYEAIKNDIERESSVADTDPEVLHFAAATLHAQWQTRAEDIVPALRGDTSVCTGKPWRDGMTAEACGRFLAAVRDVVENENRIRTLGRELAAIVSGEELPVTDLPGHAGSMPLGQESIMTIWSAGTGSAVRIGEPSLRVYALPGNEELRYATAVSNIGAALRSLRVDDAGGGAFLDAFTAAVWRYRFGVRLLTGGRAPAYPAPEIPPLSKGEAQYWHRRWPDVEERLLSLWNMLRRHAADFSPPLSPHEVVLLRFSPGFLDGRLPANVTLWARIDGAGKDGPEGDIGLSWDLPLQPMLPSIILADYVACIGDGRDAGACGEFGAAIPGGTYPSAHENPDGTVREGQLLCTQPVARRGYLCRPMPHALPGAQCRETLEEQRAADPLAIFLTSCTDSTGAPSGTTIAGPDICREGKWWDGPAFDPQNQCHVVFRCGNCGDNVSAFTSLKETDGTIDVCIGEVAESPLTYLALHELTHAYQLCPHPPGYNPYSRHASPFGNIGDDGKDKFQEERRKACCRMEGEAYQVMCAMMERDGVFREGEEYGDIPINAKTCAEAWTSISCGPRDKMGLCDMSYPYTIEFVTNALLPVLQRNPMHVDNICKPAAYPPVKDPRITDMLRTIDSVNDICSPGREVSYRNTIGNNACYMGQCLEESLERRRLTAGRMPMTSTDEAFPWDGFAKPPMPSTPILLLAPDAWHEPPPYRPRALLETFEASLCQAGGLPPRTPPGMCLFATGRGLQFPGISLVQTAQSMWRQSQDAAAAYFGVERLGTAIGRRIGTGLLAEELRHSTMSLTGLLARLVEILELAKATPLPSVMCPLDASLPSTPPGTLGP